MKKQKIWVSLHPFYESGATLGRIAANQSFIRALFRAGAFDAYHFFLQHPNDVGYLESRLREEFPELWSGNRFVVRLHRDIPEAFAGQDYYCLHLSDPFTHYSEAMTLRNAFSGRMFPITAPTHALSYGEYGNEFLKHIWSGTTPRDAVVATSSAGCRVVSNYYAQLGGAYGVGNAPGVRHIPLGVDPSSFPVPAEKDFLAKKARERFNLGEEPIFLVFARISYQSKMDLLPILRAFKRAESLGLAPGMYRLVLSGWLDEGDAFGEDIQKLATNMGIKCSLVPRPDEAAKKELFAAASVFLSPSDNLQETFGLTMLEAAVSGLPVIASDFDGYKDLVVHEETGLLVSTYGPDDTPGTDAAGVIVPASEYHLLLAQQCVVDISEMAGAIVRLASGPMAASLRGAMGRAGRERALGYAWDNIVARYLELWDELNNTPCDLDVPPPERPRHRIFHPTRPPCMHTFAKYFSAQLGDLDEAGRDLVWTTAGEAVYRGRDFPVIYNLIEGRIDLELLKKVLFMARKPVSIATVRAALEEHKSGLPEDSDFLLLWALKQDLLELAREGS